MPALGKIIFAMVRDGSLTLRFAYYELLNHFHHLHYIRAYQLAVTKILLFFGTAKGLITHQLGGEEKLGRQLGGGAFIDYVTPLRGRG